MSAERLEAVAAEDVWSIDFCFDQTTDGLPLKFLVVLDEHTRHNHALDVSRSMGADAICTALDRAALVYGPPRHLRCDNGPEMVSHALRDWCRFVGTTCLFIEPGSPWQNGYGESFIGTVRDELLNCELFTTVAEAQLLADIFRDDYNHHRPHSSLDGIPPSWYRDQATQPDPQLA
jgi:putative transposase